MKNFIVVGLVLASFAQLYGMDSDVRAMIQLENSLSPQAIELKRLLDTGMLNIVKATDIIENQGLQGDNRTQIELSMLLNAYRDKIISSAIRAVALETPSFRKLQHLRGAIELLRAFQLMNPEDPLNNRIMLALKRHPSMKELNRIESALTSGTLTLRMLQEILLAPENNAGYYIDSQTFANQAVESFRKARETLLKARVKEAEYNNVLAELTLFDLYGSREQRNEARALKKQIKNKYITSAAPQELPHPSGQVGSTIYRF